MGDPLRDAAQAPTPERWHVLPTGALLYGDDSGGITVAGLGAWQPCPERTAAVQALEALARAALAAADTAHAPIVYDHESDRFCCRECEQWGDEGGDPDTIDHLDHEAVVHASPPDEGPVTPCCGRTPFELPTTDRITLDPALVTCGTAADGTTPTQPDEVLWEGETVHVASQPGYPDDPGMSVLQLYALGCPPGTRVRVVATPATEQT